MAQKFLQSLFPRKENTSPSPPKLVSKPSTNSFIDTHRGRDAYRAHQQSKTDQERNIALQYLLFDIAEAEGKPSLWRGAGREARNRASVRGRRKWEEEMKRHSVPISRLPATSSSREEAVRDGGPDRDGLETKSIS